MLLVRAVVSGQLESLTTKGNISTYFGRSGYTNFPIRAILRPPDFKSAPLFFGARYKKNKKCSENTLD